MTGPIIPAEQWPEHAHAIVWDSDGQSLELRLFGSDWGLVYTQPHIDMPSGHDWRVPVMRPQAPAIDLARVRASVQSLLNWIDDWAETPGESGIEAIAEEAEAVLALIDGHACSVHASGVYEVSGCPECGELHCCGGNDETPRDHCMDCSVHPGKPTKGEGL